jgi:hypothetical protein
VLLALPLLFSPALAAEDPLPSDGFVVALPQGDAVGDGETPVTVHVLALRPDGTPLEDLSVRLKAKEAESVGDWTYEGDGIYAFTVVPPRVQQRGPLFVDIKGKTPDKAFKVGLVARIPLRPAPPLAITLTANPVELVSGERNEATLSFTVADGRGLEPDMLRIRTTLGQVGELAAMGGGRYVAKFDVAEVRQPGLALVTVADIRRPDRVYGGLVLPIFVKRDVTLRARSGSDVLLEVEDREYGPVEARRGRATFTDVVLPPGEIEAIQTTVRDGESEETPADLEVPPNRRIQLMPTFAGIPSDPDVVVPIRFKAVTAEGKADPDVDPEITCDRAEVVDVEHEGYGTHRIRLRPTLDAAGGPARLVVRLPDEPGQEDSLDLTFTPARPHDLAVTASPDPLGEARQATFTATVTGSGEAPLDGRTVRWNLTGATPRLATAETDRAGQADLPVETFGGPVEARATALTAAAGNRLHQVVLLPDRSWLPDDTISSTMLTVVTTDVLGYPVAGAEVKLILETGDGSLPETVTTDEHGMAQVFYTAGDVTQLVRIRAEADRGSAVASVLQGPAALKGVRLPIGGSEAHRALTEAWSRSLAGHRVEP